MINTLLQTTLENNVFSGLYFIEVHQNGKQIQFCNFQEFLSYWESHPEVKVEHLIERHIHRWSTKPLDPSDRFVKFLVRHRLPPEPVVNWLPSPIPIKLTIIQRFIRWLLTFCK